MLMHIFKRCDSKSALPALQKRVLASALISCFCVVICPTFRVMAGPINSLDCKLATLNARKRLKVKVVKSSVGKHNYAPFPTGRPQNYTIILSNSDPGSEKAISTPALLSAIASEITTACDPIGYVNFSIDQTDNSASFGLVEGRVTQFKCINFDGKQYVDAKGKKYPKVPWGYEGCP
jgi:hypothetical protein